MTRIWLYHLYVQNGEKNKVVGPRSDSVAPRVLVPLKLSSQGIEFFFERLNSVARLLRILWLIL